MINVSNEFRQLMNKRTDFKENAEITFADGTFLELSEKDFTITNNSVVDAAGSNGIPLGVALCRSIQIELMNDDDRFSEYDFFGARIRLYLTFTLSKTVERIEYGTFTVLTPETYGTTVIITALDDMYKADRNYDTTLTFPSTIGLMLRDACTNLSISQGTTTFLNDDFVVKEKPTDITYRQLFGYISMIAGGNARIDTTGRLRILTYDFELINKIKVIDGGIYYPWQNPSELDGGSFNPWNVGDVADGGLFTERNKYHTLDNWSNLKVDTDDVVITGVQTTYTDEENEEHTVIYGVDGYVLAIENPLIVGQEEFAVGLIGNVMVGGRFRQFSGDLVANPTIEFMDIALINDRKGNTYTSFVTDINFQFFGFTSIKNSAEPALRNSAKTYSNATQTLVAARKLIKNERTAREQAVAQLAKDLQNSSGLFMTQEKQADGSIIYYMHDKHTLTESMIVWKLTALAFGISTDGGKTYPYGFTVDGETVTRLLYAEGIDADYITSGTMSADRIYGGTLDVGGRNNLNGVINIYNASGQQVGVINNGGLALYSNETDLQVIISPTLGIVQRDSDGNEFYGLTYSDTFYLPEYLDSYTPGNSNDVTGEYSFTGYSNENIKLIERHSYSDIDYLRLNLIDSYSSDDYLSIFNKYRGEYIHTEIKENVLKNRIYTKNSNLEIQLPSSFKNKKWIVNITNVELDLNNLKTSQFKTYYYWNNAQPLCYEGEVYETGYFEDVLANIYDDTEAMARTYINSIAEGKPSLYVEQKKTDLEGFKIESFYSLINSEDLDYKLDYEIDSKNAILKIKGYANVNYINVNEFLKFRVSVVC